MKALIVTAYGDVENLTLEEMPEPKVGPDDVKVQVHAASINPLDWKLPSGYGRGTPMELHFPAILGRDASGDVLEVGDNVMPVQRTFPLDRPPMPSAWRAKAASGRCCFCLRTSRSMAVAGDYPFESLNGCSRT
jgi:NADPH:quinone reductase-like Zn-dependent oxidoreductase